MLILDRRSMIVFLFFFFKQKTAYEMRISDWSSDVCSSDLVGRFVEQQHVGLLPRDQRQRQPRALAAGEAVDALEGAVAGEVPLAEEVAERLRGGVRRQLAQVVERRSAGAQRFDRVLGEVADAQVRMRVALAGQRLEFADQGLDQRRLAGAIGTEQADAVRSEEHTSELQSLMRISYA